MRRKNQRAAVRFAASAMERATVGVPSETRDRYHDELVAEMHDLGRSPRGDTPWGSPPRPRRCTPP